MRIKIIPLPPATHSLEFCFLRESRIVIQNGGMRDQLLRLPRMQSICPVQIVFFRRFGLGE